MARTSSSIRSRATTQTAAESAPARRSMKGRLRMATASAGSPAFQRTAGKRRSLRADVAATWHRQIAWCGSARLTRRSATGIAVRSRSVCGHRNGAILRLQRAVHAPATARPEWWAATSAEARSGWHWRHGPALRDSFGAGHLAIVCVWLQCSWGGDVPAGRVPSLS